MRHRAVVGEKRLTMMKIEVISSLQRLALRQSARRVALGGWCLSAWGQWEEWLVRRSAASAGAVRPGLATWW